MMKKVAVGLPAHLRLEPIGSNAFEERAESLIFAKKAAVARRARFTASLSSPLSGSRTREPLHVRYHDAAAFHAQQAGRFQLVKQA